MGNVPSHEYVLVMVVWCGGGGGGGGGAFISCDHQHHTLGWGFI